MIIAYARVFLDLRQKRRLDPEAYLQPEVRLQTAERLILRQVEFLTRAR